MGPKLSGVFGKAEPELGAPWQSEEEWIVMQKLKVGVNTRISDTDGLPLMRLLFV